MCNSCLWEAAIQENVRNKVVIRSSHQNAFCNIAVRRLYRNSLKNYCDGVGFLVKLHVNCFNELKNPMLVGYNFTENFTVDVAEGIFRNVWNNIQSCFSWRIYRSITIKSNQFAGKKYRPSDFLKKQRE